MLDFSILKSIDFSNSNNLLFFSIFLILAIILFFVVLAVIFEIFHALAKLFGKHLHIPRQVKSNAQSDKKIMEDSPKHKVAGEMNMNFESDKKENGAQKDFAKTDKEKEQKSISDQLNGLKSKKGEPENNSMQSRMPSTDNKKENEDSKKIEIPRAKKVTGEETPVTRASGLGSNLTKTQDAKKATQSAGNMGNISVSIKSVSNTDSKITKEVHGFSQKNEVNPARSVSEDSQPEQNSFETRLGSGVAVNREKDTGGDILFGNKDEISRINMRIKLRRDPKIWKAERKVGLTLSPVERVKLEKQIFPTVYGRNISKSDLKKNLKRMSKEWGSATEPGKKTLLRREMKFLKNIGGIK